MTRNPPTLEEVLENLRQGRSSTGNTTFDSGLEIAVNGFLLDTAKEYHGMQIGGLISRYQALIYLKGCLSTWNAILNTRPEADDPIFGQPMGLEGDPLIEMALEQDSRRHHIVDDLVRQAHNKSCEEERAFFPKSLSITIDNCRILADLLLSRIGELDPRVRNSRDFWLFYEKPELLEEKEPKVQRIEEAIKNITDIFGKFIKAQVAQSFEKMPWGTPPLGLTQEQKKPDEDIVTIFENLYYEFLNYAATFIQDSKIEVFFKGLNSIEKRMHFELEYIAQNEGEEVRERPIFQQAREVLSTLNGLLSMNRELLVIEDFDREATERGIVAIGSSRGIG